MASSGTILVVTDPLDPHAEVVMGAVEARGVECVRFHPAELLRGFLVTARAGPGEAASATFTTPAGRTASSRDVRAVYNRGWQAVRRPAVVEEDVARFAAEESQINFRYLLGALDECFWLTHPDRIRAASYKSRQLAAAREAGIAVPRTLWSNDPAEIIRFAREVGGTVVAKPVADVYYVSGDRPHSVWVSPVDVDYLESCGGDLATTLGYYQELVPRERDLRVTVVGDRLFPCEMRMRGVGPGDGPVDWRTHRDGCANHIVELPEGLADRILKLNRVLGVLFGALDFVRTPSGEYVFLESNVNGQWLWIQQDTGADIAGAVADLLLSGDGPAGED